MEECDFRAQFLCLGRNLGDEPLAQRAHVVWSGLSSACHHHVYDLAPTREELQAWRETVQLVVDRTERAWRPDGPVFVERESSQRANFLERNRSRPLKTRRWLRQPGHV